MGNAIGGGGGRRRVKVMKVDGETLKFKSPVRGWDVLKDHPGLVLLDADDVKRYGIRAKPVEPQLELKSRKIYFLVQLPNNNKPEAAAADSSRNNLHRKVQSGINMSAKDRLELLMLSKRSASDVIVRPSSDHHHHHHHREEVMTSSGSVRLKMRLPRSQVAKMVEESRDGAEVAAKIMDLYKESSGGGGLYSRGSSVGSSSAFNSQELSKPTTSGNSRQAAKSHHPKRVSFLATDDVGATKSIDSQQRIQLPS